MKAKSELQQAMDKIFENAKEQIQDILSVATGSAHFEVELYKFTKDETAHLSIRIRGQRDPFIASELRIAAKYDEDSFWVTDVSTNGSIRMTWHYAPQFLTLCQALTHISVQSKICQVFDVAAGEVEQLTRKN